MTSPLRKRLALSVSALVMAGGLTACGSDGSVTTNADGDTVIRYQSIAGLVNPAELADALGYLEDADIEIKRVGGVNSGPEDLRALGTGQVDVALAFQGAVANLVATGVEITPVVAAYGASGDVTNALVTRTETGISTAKDLIGKKVAVNGLGAHAEAVIDTWLAAEGLSADEIEKVTLVPVAPAVAEGNLREKQVDAAFLGGATLFAAFQRDGLTRVFTDTDTLGEYNAGSLSMADEFLDENPDAAKGFVSAIAKAEAWAADAEVDEVRSLMTEYLIERDRKDEADVLAAWRGTGIATEGGVLREQDFSVWIDWLVESGQLDEGKLDAATIFTNEFNSYADKD